MNPKLLDKHIEHSIVFGRLLRLDDSMLLTLGLEVELGENLGSEPIESFVEDDPGTDVKHLEDALVPNGIGAGDENVDARHRNQVPIHMVGPLDGSCVVEYEQRTGLVEGLEDRPGHVRLGFGLVFDLVGQRELFQRLVRLPPVEHVHMDHLHVVLALEVFH